MSSPTYSGTTPGRSGRVCRRIQRTASPLLQSMSGRSEEHTSELQSLMRSSYAVFCLKKKTQKIRQQEKENKGDTRSKKSTQTGSKEKRQTRTKEKMELT